MSNRQWNVDIDLGDIVGWICLVGLLVLCIGEPDLLDAIIAWVGRQP